MTTTLNEDFRDLLQVFVEGDVQFLIVGAYALAVHGLPRATGDLEVWIEPTPQNASRAYAALARFGAPLADLAEQDLATPGTVFQIGVIPRRIDVLTQLTGVDFAAAWPHRITSTYAQIQFPVIGRDELIENKRATGRPKDLVDLDALNQLPRG
ncbi:MAG TPA: hypothetical protein VKE49_13905 [Myxococcaceae bacterium]|nr:hypothetical protein [Myxococcaceae bacterium]